MIPPLPEIYRRFADREVGAASPCYVEWAHGVADDPELLALIEELGGVKRQPHLVFAAARHTGIEPGPFVAFRAALVATWPAIRSVIMARRTQTNEPGRCAALLPVLAALPQPLALLEVGASAGLCLLPDRYSYRYGDRRIDPPSGPSPVLLECEVDDAVPVPERLPTIAWRAGIDLNPLDVDDADDVRWLETLIWPGQEARRQRLSAAIGIARADPPRVVRGDLTDEHAVAALADTAPADATLVVMHSAVLAYLEEAARARFVAGVTEMRGHWVSMEGPSIAPLAGGVLPPSPEPGRTLFVVEVDGTPVAWADAQGRSLYWSDVQARIQFRGVAGQDAGDDVVG